MASVTWREAERGGGGRRQVQKRTAVRPGTAMLSWLLQQPLMYSGTMTCEEKSNIQVLEAKTSFVLTITFKSLGRLVVSYKVVNRWFTLLLKHHTYFLSNQVCSWSEKLQYPWCCKDNFNNQTYGNQTVTKELAGNATNDIIEYVSLHSQNTDFDKKYNFLYIAYLDTINNFNWIVLHLPINFHLIMSITMLHGIVVLSLKATNLVFLLDFKILFCF